MYKKMYNVVTVGGPETTLGTAVARSARLPVTDFVEINKSAAKNPSNVLTGRGTKRRNYIDSIEAGMSIPLELQAIGGIGKLLVSAIGEDLDTPAQVIAAMVLSYTGSSASAKIVVTTTTVAATIGDLGSESADTNFGTAGTYTFADIDTDVAALEADTDWSCTKLFGATAAATVGVGYAISSAQAAGNSVIIYFTGTSGAYLHRFSPVLTNTERPTLTFQADGTGLTNDILAGAVVDSVEFTAELKGRAAMTANVIGTAVTTGTASALALADKKPLKFADGEIFIAGAEETYVKSVSFSIGNNHDSDEGFGTGSFYKQDHAKGDFVVTGSVTVRSTTTSEVEYAKRITDTLSSLLTVFQGDDLATDIPEMVAISAPYLDILNPSKTASGVGLDTELSFEAIDPQSYNNIVTIDMITADSGTYE